MKALHLFYPVILSPSLIAGDFSKDIIVDSSPSPKGWTTSVAIGPNWRHFGDVQYSGNSESQTSLIPSFVGQSSLTLPPIGDENAIGDRSYNDGFVNQDAGTEVNGLTWNWGYNSTTQVQGNNLVYTATGFRSDFSESYSSDPARERNEDLSGPGIVADITLHPPGKQHDFFNGILVSFAYFSDDSEFDFSSFSGVQTLDNYSLNFTDTFDTTGIIVPLRDNYSGTFAGPGPKIDNTPTSRSQIDQLLNSDEARFSNSIFSSFDLDAFSLALGPTFQTDLSSGWSIQTSVGVTLNVYKWSARQKESLSVSINNGPPNSIANFSHKTNETDFNVGGFARVGISKSLSSEWYSSFHLQGEIAPEIDVDIGPSSYKIDPSGYSVAFLIGKTF